MSKASIDSVVISWSDLEIIYHFFKGQVTSVNDASTNLISGVENSNPNDYLSLANSMDNSGD